MKYGIKRFNENELAMMRAVVNLDQFDAKSIMIRKGDIEKPIYRNPNNSINWVPLRDTLLDDEMPKGKSMKAADRRKRTYHKQQQRERQYRNLGYPIERFSASERGKMREGVGMFPKTTHMNSMYNRNCFNGGMRGNRKYGKHITTKQALDMMEHEKWLDEQEIIAEQEKAEWLMVACGVEDMKQEVCRVNDELEYCNSRLDQMKEYINELNDSINHMRQRKAHLIESIMKNEGWLEAHKK